jgi:hypothetical protein
MHIMHNLEIEYLCLGTPMAANILNLLVSRWEWSFAHHTVIYLAYQYTPFHCKMKSFSNELKSIFRKYLSSDRKFSRIWSISVLYFILKVDRDLRLKRF